jgi:putative aldouronate transport system substrate-binding protein
MVLALFSMPGWSTAQQEEATAPGIPDKIDLPLKEKITVTYSLAEHTTIGRYAFADDGHPGFQWLEEQTNIEIDPIQISPGEIQSKYQLWLATGDLPDIFNPGAANLSKADLDGFGDKGLFVNILEYAHLIPNYMKLMDEVLPLKNMITRDGKLYGFATYNRDPIPFSLSLAYREDLWKKHNLKSDTWEEAYEAFKILKREYPESYPVCAWQTGDRAVLLFMAGANFNTDESIYYDRDKEDWAYGPLDDEYDYFLEYFARLWEEELLHPGTFTMNYDQWSHALANHESFFTWWWSASGNWFSPVTQFKLPDFGPGKDWTFSAMRIPSLVEGGPRARSINTMPYGNYGYVKLVSSNSEYIPEIMAFMNFLCVEENVYSMIWGPRGVLWDIIDGKYRWIVPEIKTPYNTEGTMPDHEYFEKRYGVRTSSANVGVVGNDNPRMEANMTIESNPDYQQFEDEARQYVADGSTPQIPAPITNFSSEDKDREAQLKTALDTYAQEQSIKFITGQRPLSEIGAFKEELESMGTQELLDLYRKASGI